MKFKNKIVASLSLLMLAPAAYAAPFAFDARSLGMGGVSVATADLATATWTNPAMLTRQQANDDFSLLLGFGAQLRDHDDLISDIDDFQAANNRRDAAMRSGNVTATVEALLDMQQIASGVDGKILSPEMTGMAAVALAFDTFAMAFSVRGDVIAGGTITNISCDLSLPSCNRDEILSDQFNILNVEGVLATEFGVSLAKDFWLFDRKVSIGVKPKIVDLQAFTFREAILTVSTGFDNVTNKDVEIDLGTFATVDLGLAMDLTDSIRLGLNLRNLITDDFELGGQILNFDTQARVGIAYHSQFVTVAVDYDLIENEPLLANKAFDGLTTQYLAVGAEFNAFDFAQLRIGAAKNVANGISEGAKNTVYTAGVGLWLGFNLDVSASFTETSIGVFAQTGFRF